MSNNRQRGRDEATSPLASRDGRREQLYLLVVGSGIADVYALPSAGTVTVGRASECDVIIDDPSMSRKHAAIDIAGSLRIRDLGSANGVYVERKRVAPGAAVEVFPGQTIELGAIVAVVQHTAILATAADERAPVVAGRPPVTGARSHEVVVHDAAMKSVFELVERIGPSGLNVLLLGETGVGKEVVAEALQRSSKRATQPFLRLNCAALSPSLLESELFGHERGAFTGAVRAKTGLLESADGGTVFLDEVGEMPMELQVKLLRVLEEQRVLRVGGLEPRPFDVRFIAATNRDLREEIARGVFRQDLYFRLCGISIFIPPLRDRPTEIEILARSFVSAACRAAGRTPAPPIAPDALAVLQGYAWPGNIRELRNAVDCAVVLSGHGPITAAHLPPELTGAKTGPRSLPPAAPEDVRSLDTIPPVDRARRVDSAQFEALKGELQGIERRRILDALERCDGNQTHAAKSLGMPRRTFVARLKEYDIARRRTYE